MKNILKSIALSGLVFSLTGCGKSKFTAKSEAKSTPEVVVPAADDASSKQIVASEKSGEEQLRGRRPFKISLTLVLDTGPNFALHFENRKSNLDKFVKFIWANYPGSGVSAYAFDDTILAREQTKYDLAAESLLKTVLSQVSPWFKAPLGTISGGFGAGAGFGDNDKNFGFGAFQEALSALPDVPDTKHIVFYQSNALARETEYSYDTRITAGKLKSKILELKEKNQDLVFVWSASSAQLLATAASYSTPREQILKVISESKVNHLEMGLDFSKLEEISQNKGERLFNSFIAK